MQLAFIAQKNTFHQKGAFYSSTQTHTLSDRLYMRHSPSPGKPQHWWKAALPQCCTLLHLDLWASCIFNGCNLHRACMCRCALHQRACLTPYLYSPLTLQLLFWGQIKCRPWYRRLSDDMVFITQWSERIKTYCTSPSFHCGRLPSLLQQEALLQSSRCTVPTVRQLQLFTWWFIALKVTRFTDKFCSAKK